MNMYDKIDALLEEKKMSRRQLAHAAGISENTLSGAFRRKTKNFAVENVIRIANVLGVSWIELVGRPDIEEDDAMFVEAASRSLAAFERLSAQHQALADLAMDEGYVIRKEVDGEFVLETRDGIYTMTAEDMNKLMGSVKKTIVLQVELIAQREHQKMLEGLLRNGDE